MARYKSRFPWPKTEFTHEGNSYHVETKKIDGDDITVVTINGKRSKLHEAFLLAFDAELHILVSEELTSDEEIQNLKQAALDLIKLDNTNLTSILSIIFNIASEFFNDEFNDISMLIGRESFPDFPNDVLPN